MAERELNLIRQELEKPFEDADVYTSLNTYFGSIHPHPPSYVSL
jgi:hypothetical protein